MANEIIGKKERFILVQTNLDTKAEFVIAKNPFGSGFNAFVNPEQATDFETQEKAKKIADALNGLYLLSGDNYEVKVAKETTDRQYITVQ